MNTRPGPRDLLIISFFSFIALGIPQALLGVGWIYMQGTFNVTLDALGVILTVSSIGRLIATFSSGHIIGMLGVSRYLLLGSVLSAVGALGYALAASWWALLVLTFVWGLGAVAINNGINVFVAANYKASRMNWLHAWFGFGNTIAPTLLTIIVIDLSQSWQWSYVVLAAFQLAMTIMLLFTLKRWEIDLGEASRRKESHADRPPMRDTFKLWPLWFVMGLFVLHSGVQLSAGQLTSALFIEGRGIDPKVAANWITTYWASLTIGRFVTGMIVDRIGGRALLRINTFLIVIGAVMVWWHLTDVFSLVGLALMGYGIAPIAPTLVSQTPERVGKRHTPNAIGFQFSASAIGSAILPGLGAALAQHVGLETVGLYLVVLALATFLLHEWLLMRERRVLAPQPDPA